MPLQTQADSEDAGVDGPADELKPELERDPEPIIEAADAGSGVQAAAAASVDSSVSSQSAPSKVKKAAVTLAYA